MADNTKLQYIVELLTQGDTKKATEELNKLNKSGEGASKGLNAASASAKQLFAFLGGTALITESINKFLEAERGVNALNAALEMTGHTAPGVAREVRELAEALGEDLKKDADDVVKVMTQLITFGANPRDLRRLTESVFDLSEVMGRDVSRAARGMAQALRGNFEVFQQLGIEVDKNKGATEGFNEAYRRMVEMIEGRGRKAVQGTAGDVEALKVTLDDAKEKVGEWTSALLTAVANSAAAFGKVTASSTVAEANAALGEVHDKARTAIEKEIAAMEELGKVTRREAESIRTSLALAFGEDIFDTIDRSMLTPPARKVRDSAAEERALQEAAGKLGIRGFDRTPKTAAGPGPIQTPGLSEKDFQQQMADLEEKFAFEDSLIDQINKQYEDSAALRIRQDNEAFENYRNAERLKQDLHDQIVLTVLDGEQRVQAEMEINHQRRVQMIQDTKFETEEQYMEAMTHEEALFLAEQQRYNQSQTYSFKLKQDMMQVAESGAQAFSSGLAGAIVSAFEEGDKAFQKFAANFLRQIAEMILQTIILNSLRAAGRALGFADGGQAAAMANGGMIYAANGVSGVMDVGGPTYFPKFNVLAGEAGREVMTVLSRPRFERINGVPAQIGYAGGNRLAITSADALARGGGGAGGLLRIEVSYSKDAEARITENSVQNARVAVVQDMAQDSQLSRVTRQKMA